MVVYPLSWPPLGSRLSRGDVESGGGAGGVGGSWRAAAGAAGWTEFMGCGEAAGPDPEPEPRAPILGRASLWPRCSQPQAPLPRLSRRLLPGRGGRPSPSSNPLPYAARAPRRAGRPRRLCLPSRAGAGRGAGAQRRARRPEGLAQRPPASRLRGSDTAAQEAARRPCRAEALLSLVWNSHPTRKPQAGQRPWGAGAAPGGGVDSGCGLRETRGLRI